MIVTLHIDGPTADAVRWACRQARPMLQTVGHRAAPEHPDVARLTSVEDAISEILGDHEYKDIP